MRILLLISLFLIGCKKEFKSKQIQTQYEKVMVIHDEVMPEMSTINRIKRNIKKNGSADSISMTLLNQLKRAEDGMMEWMADFDLDHSLSEAEQLKYLETEELKIAEVSRIMKRSIKTGNQFLGKSK